MYAYAKSRPAFNEIYFISLTEDEVEEESASEEAEA